LFENGAENIWCSEKGSDNSYGGKHLFEEINSFSFSSNIVLLTTSMVQGLSWEADSHSSG
jgi:hypothetical protein